MQTEVPSLSRLCLFAIKKSAQLLKKISQEQEEKLHPLQKKLLMELSKQKI